jgi:hypothetical protein
MSVDKWREPLYLCDTLVDGLQGLMLAHVIDHFSMGPALVLSQSSPVVVVLSGGTYIPGESQSVTMGRLDTVIYIMWLTPLEPPSIFPLTM